MKPLYLTIQEVHQRTGIEPVARAVGVSPRAVYQWGESPSESGKISPIKRFQDWAEIVTSMHDPEINALVLGIIRQVLDNMELTVFSTQQVEAMRKMAAMLVPSDNRLDESPATTLCPRCGEAPLEFVAGPNIFHCRVCGGR